MKKNNIKIKNKKGFVLFIAIMVSSILISVAMFIAFIAQKELILAQSAKSTQQAFYAADSAVECALYQDFRKAEFRRNSNQVNFPNQISCAHGVLGIINYLPNLSTATPSDGSSNGTAISYYEGSLSDDMNDTANQPYVRVRVKKIDIDGPHEKTIIEAWGHNIKKNSTALVERALKVVY